MKNPGEGRRETPLFWHYPLARPHFLGGHSGSAIRRGSWKRIEWFDTKKGELFNLQDDPSEKNDLFAQHGQIAGRLLNQLRSWRKGLGAKTTVDGER